MLTPQAFRDSISEQLASPSNPSMNILIWNCRGATRSTFRTNFMHLIQIQSAKVVILTETRLEGIDATQIMESLHFENHARIDSVGRTGGIWILWKGSNICLEITDHNDREIHAVIKVVEESAGSEQGSSHTP